MGKLTFILLWLIPTLAAAAQPPATPNHTPNHTPAPATPDAAATPSRYAGADPTTYAAALAKRMAILSRAHDPFGQPQDPDAKPVVKPTLAKTTRRSFKAEPPAPLSEIVSQIKVTTVMPKARRFLISDRALGVGDKIPINYRNKQILTQITEVSAARIVFKNTETNEIGILKLDMLPSGMTKGTASIIAPGMSPTDPDAPLEVGSPLSQSVGSITP
ncbi:MAG: hypothetical protein K9N23_16290 [Akkermansiaceae bacterium]|nr:hypothetical protein [Akkermansiaceae bacterium]MCF7733251.1 hypothetical protein [Akkermansiaceae bacterium]